MNKIKISGKLTRIVAIALCVFFMAAHAFAQKRFERRKPVKVGGGMELVSPGNCHGVMFSPLLSLNKGKHSVFAAGYFQKRSYEFVGGRFGYSINLTDGCSRNTFWGEDEEDSLMISLPAEPENSKPVFHLNAFFSTQYYHQSLLSKSSVNIETRTARDQSSANWSSYRMSTVELAAGVELNFRFSKRITWKNTVGVAVYNHLDYSIPMYSSKIAPTLMLGTGIHICPL